ncbi:hypothetical protein HAZT_HAZT004224 [Hyalella azteca]|uniref:Retrotransposon gag domain-containing protein n=1 Tax=Hyalella azteca TaxID=294128 RepID=A0A6A0GWQ6_HYAAZ|nr:hypothetical protein HAZT_HAZT004224 [Hyalella azteca]
MRGKENFLTFRTASKLHVEDESVQVASLKYCMGAEAEDVFRTFELGEEEAKNFEIVLERFDGYFKPKINIIRLRRIFQRRIQQPGENEETYLRSLFVASQDCEFGISARERIRDQFIAGLSDEKLAEKLEHLYLSKTKFHLGFGRGIY